MPRSADQTNPPVRPLGSSTVEIDPSRWQFARRSAGGIIEDLFLESGFLDSDGKDHAVVCSIWERSDFPAAVAGTFKRKVLSQSSCARCGKQETEIHLREHDPAKSRRTYIVCSCGHPVWRITFSSFCQATQAIARVGYSRTRRERLKASGGKHTAGERHAILALQDGRCIYCNALFGPDCRAQRDHLLPVSEGGCDSAWNLVLACQACNRRRGTTPFRTYCTSLSQAQNRRILRFLVRRVLSSDADTMDGPGFATFVHALRRHNPRDFGYRWILEHSEQSRRRAGRNNLLPTMAQLLNLMQSDVRVLKMAIEHDAAVRNRVSKA